MLNERVVICESCGAWEMSAQDPGVGTCRLYAPKIFVVGTQQGAQTLSAFPSTNRRDGCAEGFPSVLQ